MINLKSIVHGFGRWYCQEICRREYENQRFLYINERSIEFEFVFRQLRKMCPKEVLDVGSGITSLPHLMRACGYVVTSIDNVSDYWPRGMVNRHYHVINDDITKPKLKDTFDFITCISVLEYIENFNKAVENMFKLLRGNGYLLMTFPYNENQFIQNIYQHPCAGYGKNLPYTCKVFSRREISNWLLQNKAVLVEQEYWQFWSGDFWTFGTRILPPKSVSNKDLHQITCLLLRKTL